MTARTLAWVLGGPPTLPRPTGAHLVTSWGDRYGRTHRSCSCGASMPAPGMASGWAAYGGPTAGQVADTLLRSCVDYSTAAGALERWCRLIAARPIHGAAHATRDAANRRARGLAYLALFVAACGPAQDETPRPTHVVPAQGAPVARWSAGSPTTVRDLRAAQPVRGAHPERTDAEAEHAEAALAGASAGDPAGISAEAISAPRRWYAPGWQKPPRCHSCRQYHYQRWAGGGHLRPCTPADPVTRTYDVCRECGWTVDPVAVAEFGGKHAECSLPPGEREHWVASVREHGWRRRAAERRQPATQPREDTAA